MENLTDIAGVSHVIQIAVAPVFLLSGIGAILGVLINRLGRVTDRFRVLDNHAATLPENARDSVQTEMRRLARRARLVHWAIGICTCSALLVCVVIALLFAGVAADIKAPAALIATLFILAMLSLVTGLLLFLREIALAQGSIHTIPR